MHVCKNLLNKCLLVTAHLSTLLTVLALAVDQYLAICRPLYHRTDVNISRVNVALIAIWICCLLCSSLEIVVPVNTPPLFILENKLLLNDDRGQADPVTMLKKLKGSPYSITERRVPQLIPFLGSQPVGDVSHKPDGRLPLLSTRPAVTPATLQRAATNFAAW